MINLSMNGIELSVDRGTTLLEAAQFFVAELTRSTRRCLDGKDIVTLLLSLVSPSHDRRRRATDLAGDSMQREPFVQEFQSTAAAIGDEIR